MVESGFGGSALTAPRARLRARYFVAMSQRVVRRFGFSRMIIGEDTVSLSLPGVPGASMLTQWIAKCAG
jgi:hypothetical protein